MKRNNFILKIYSISLTLILAFILTLNFILQKPIQNAKEITVERINIVEPNGNLKMVISNQKSQHPGMIDRELFTERKRAPGIIFFNEEGDEVGGLIYSGNKEEGANLVLSIDQYKNDQVMQLMQYSNQDGENQYGLQLWQRDKNITQPIFMKLMDSLDKEGFNYRQKLALLKEKNNGLPIVEQRLFIGKKYNSETGLFIQDQFGVDRLRIYVDAKNSPKFEVLNEKGEVLNNILIE